MMHRKNLVAIAASVITAFMSAAESATPDASTVYWCLMRGKPCAVTDFAKPGNCPECGMKLVTKGEYGDYMAKHHANTTRVGILLYPGFEVLDACGPIEMFSYLQEFELVTVAEKQGLVTSTQGAKMQADFSFEDCPKLDILLVPGGMGTLIQLRNERLLEFIRSKHAETSITASVCSGSALLAKAGVLDGHKATSNKKYFELAAQQSDKVDWVRQARWVDDGKVVTSSGVSAGMDMALHLVSRLFGEARAEKAAEYAEYIWHKDASDDPFATPVAKK